jgi:hypothetical protein
MKLLGLLSPWFAMFPLVLHRGSHRFSGGQLFGIAILPLRLAAMDAGDTTQEG